MGDLRPGERLLLAGGNGEAVVESVTEQNAAPGEAFTTYNFEVEDWHTYFVMEVEGSFCLWVHNTCGEGGDLLASNSGLSVVSRPGMASRVVTAPNGQSLTVWGQAERAASTTPGHAEAMNNLVARLAATGEYEFVTLQRNWRTATGRVGTSRLIPDVIGVRRGGVVDAWEVRSASDVEEVLRQRLKHGMSSLPPANRGQFGVIPPEPPL